MSVAASVHSFWLFSRESNTSFQVLACDNRALAWKNHVQAQCKFSYHTPASWAEYRTAVLSSKSARRVKSKHFASKRLLFGKSGPDWDICASAMKLFLREIHPVYRHWQWVLRAILHGNSDVAYKLVELFQIKSDNIVWVIGSPQESDWQWIWINPLPALHSHDTWRESLSSPAGSGLLFHGIRCRTGPEPAQLRIWIWPSHPKQWHAAVGVPEYAVMMGCQQPEHTGYRYWGHGPTPYTEIQPHTGYADQIMNVVMPALLHATSQTGPAHSDRNARRCVRRKCGDGPEVWDRCVASVVIHLGLLAQQEAGSPSNQVHLKVTLHV